MRICIENEPDTYRLLENTLNEDLENGSGVGKDHRDNLCFLIDRCPNVVVQLDESCVDGWNGRDRVGKILAIYTV
jgi:hypothetical protein